MNYADELQQTFNNIQNSFAGATPTRGVNGLITGYTQPGRTYTATAAPPETGVLDPVTGLYKSSKTGAIWNGSVTNANGTSSTVQNGKLLPQDAYGNTLPVFTTTQTVKQPGIAAAANNLLSTNNTDTAALTKSFTDYLNEAKTLGDQGATQLTKDQAAVDPTDTINRLNTDSTNTADALNANNRNYVANQNQVQSDVANENTAAATTSANRIAALKTNLDANNAQYEAASQAVAQQAWNKAQQGLSIYQLGSGTPTSASGNLSNRAIRAYTAINVPLQQDLANRATAETQTLDQQQQQADAQNYQDLINQYSGKANLNSDVANRIGTTAQYTGNLDATTAAQIQQLKTSTAGMSRAQAATYLQQLGIPFSVGQQVIAGQIQNLAGIQNVDANANYYTANTPYDPSRVPSAPTFSSGVPQRNYSPQAPIGINNGVRSYAPAPVTANGQPAPTPAPGQPAAPYGYGQNGVQLQYADTPGSGLTNMGGGIYVDSLGNAYNAQGAPVSYNTMPTSGGSNTYPYAIQPSGTDAGGGDDGSDATDYSGDA